MSKDKSEKQGNWFKRHKFLTVLLVIVVIVIAATAGKGSEDKNSNNSNGNSSNNNQSSQEEAKIGTAVRDGKFEFVVKSVECGKTEVVHPEVDSLRKTAQGQYCLVALSVKNIGDKQQMFLQSDQKLLNASGQQYSPDDTATLYNSANTDAFLSQINPGNSVEGVIVFDIPADATPTTAQLHDSSFSGGVKVTLQ